jgi:type I restriction enzyme S subunit
MVMNTGYKKSEAGIIPEEWKVFKLEETAMVVDSLHQTPSFAEDGYPMVRVTDIKTGNLSFAGTLRVSEAVFAEFTKNYKPKRDDIVLSRVGSYGISSFVEIDESFCMGQNTVVLHPKLPARFLYYVLNSRGVRQQIEDGSYGSGYKSLSLKNIKELRIPVPPTDAERNAIAEALSDVDVLIEALDQLIGKKHDLKQAAIQELLTGRQRLPGFHGEWEKKELGKLGQISGAGVDKKIRPDEPSVRLVNYMDVYRRNFIYSKDLNHVASARPEQAARCAVKRGDVFFTPSSEMPFDIAVSAVAMEDIPDAAYSYHIVRLRLDEDWDLLFRVYAFKSHEFLNQAARACEGSGVRYVITQGKFRQLSVRFPPTKEEQTAIAEVLSDMHAELDVLEQRRDKTRALKQGMMQELLTGRIRLV